MKILSKQERLTLLIERLKQAPACSSEEGVLLLIEETLDQIEDEFSGVVKDPKHFESQQTDERMYAPHARFKVTSKVAGCVCYRQARHKTYIAPHGAFRIVAITPQGEQILVDKAGIDGQSIH